MVRPLPGLPRGHCVLLDPQRSVPLSCIPLWLWILRRLHPRIASSGCKAHAVDTHGTFVVQNASGWRSCRRPPSRRLLQFGRPVSLRRLPGLDAAETRRPDCETLLDVFRILRLTRASTSRPCGRAGLRPHRRARRVASWTAHTRPSRGRRVRWAAEVNEAVPPAWLCKRAVASPLSLYLTECVI